MAKSIPFEEVVQKENNTLCQHKENKFLCCFHGLNYVMEVCIKDSNNLILLSKRATPSQVKHLTLGDPGGKETLFASFYDNTVRSFTIEKHSLKELAKITFSQPEQVLWLRSLSQLIVADWDSSKKAHKLQNVHESIESRNKFEVNTCVALDSDQGVCVRCWDVISENRIFCFNWKKREILELKMN